MERAWLARGLSEFYLTHCKQWVERQVTLMPDMLLVSDPATNRHKCTVEFQLIERVVLEPGLSENKGVIDLVHPRLKYRFRFDLQSEYRRWFLLFKVSLQSYSETSLRISDPSPLFNEKLRSSFALVRYHIQEREEEMLEELTKHYRQHKTYLKGYINRVRENLPNPVYFNAVCDSEKSRLMLNLEETTHNPPTPHILNTRVGKGMLKPLLTQVIRINLENSIELSREIDPQTINQFYHLQTVRVLTFSVNKDVVLQGISFFTPTVSDKYSVLTNLNIKKHGTRRYQYTHPCNEIIEYSTSCKCIVTLHRQVILRKHVKYSIWFSVKANGSVVGVHCKQTLSHGGIGWKIFASERRNLHEECKDEALGGLLASLHVALQQ